MIARLLAYFGLRRPVSLPAPDPAAPMVLSAQLHDTLLTRGELIALLWEALSKSHPEPNARSCAVALVVERVQRKPPAEA